MRVGLWIILELFFPSPRFTIYLMLYDSLIPCLIKYELIRLMKKIDNRNHVGNDKLNHIVKSWDKTATFLSLTEQH